MFSLARTLPVACRQTMTTAVRATSASSSRSFHWTPSAAMSQEGETTPLELVQTAMDALSDFSERLRTVAKSVDHRHTVSEQGRPISVAEITLHSRDCSVEEFGSPAARSARDILLGEAKTVEASMKELVELYMKDVGPKMAQASKACQETPCGGASWELDMESLIEKATKQGNEETPDGNQTVNLSGLEGTPCGRLQMASLNFIEATMETKPQMMMAARARFLLELAMEFDTPLKEVRQNGTKEQNQKIMDTFEAQVVPTPWIPSDEEYANLMQIKQSLET
eukprot:Nitzschia sp. Nitz4//scaffold63_size106090//93394//94239//NITZ4_004413-RA/size106090-processed-gene-0.155-mRNA-1//-1//CDS//3329556044//4114//frame0